MPRRLKRSPHSGDGVASRRNWWRWWPFRITASTCVKASGGVAGRVSSLQRMVPPRSTNSRWEKNQSAMALWPLCGVFDTSSPPTKMRPSALRRMSNSGCSITNCSKPSRQIDEADSAAIRCGRCTASRPALSNRRTSCSSNEGIAPGERAVMLPMRTGTPNARLASNSRRGRNSPIRGTIQAWSTNQVRPNNSQPAATSHSNARRAAANQHKRREGKAGEASGLGEVDSISRRIMTADAARARRRAMKFCEVL